MRRAGNMIRIDLYREYIRCERPTKSISVGRCAVMVVGVICAVAVCLASSYFLMKKNALVLRAQELDRIIMSEERTNGIREYERVSAENEKLTELNNILSEHLRPLDTSEQYTAYSPDLFLRIERSCRGFVTLVDISASDYTFALVFRARDAAVISDFVSRLKAEDIFAAIDYRGYCDVSGGYEFTLSCVLSAERGGVLHE